MLEEIEKIDISSEMIYEPIVWTEVVEFLEIWFTRKFDECNSRQLYELAIEYADKNQADTAKIF